MSPNADRHQDARIRGASPYVVAEVHRQDRASYRESMLACHVAIDGCSISPWRHFPEAGPGRLRSGLDSALRAHDPHANRHITFPMTLVSPCRGLGKVTADTRVKGSSVDDKVQVDTA